MVKKGKLKAETKQEIQNLQTIVKAIGYKNSKANGVKKEVLMQENALLANVVNNMAE